jgi:hypothetical protein
VVGVGIVEEELQLLLLQFPVDDRQLTGDLGRQLGVAVGQLAELDQVAGLGLQPLPALELGAQLRGLTRDASSVRGVVPDAGGG